MISDYQARSRMALKQACRTPPFSPRQALARLVYRSPCLMLRGAPVYIAGLLRPRRRLAIFIHLRDTARCEIISSRFSAPALRRATPKVAAGCLGRPRLTTAVSLCRDAAPRVLRHYFFKVYHDHDSRRI